MVGIYKIENKVNGKIYIGQSVNIKQRWSEHKANLRNHKHENSYLQNAWNKYGEDSFIFKILEECNEEDLDLREIFWISTLNSYINFDNSNGYNLTIGGGGTRKIHKVSQLSLTGEFITEWDNGIIAGQKTGISISSIYGCCIGRLNSAGGYIWIYSEECNNKSIEEYVNKQKCRIVFQYDLEGNFIKEWESLAQIISELHINPVECVNHINYSCHGYIFKYKNDPLEITPEYAGKVKNILKNLTNKPFYQINQNANIIKRYNSLTEAVNDGWSDRLINECCRGLRNNYKGYIWIYEKEYDYIDIDIDYCMSKLQIEPRKYYSVLMYDLEDNFIKEYPYLKDVKKDGFRDIAVYDCCCGRTRQHKGYKWRFGKEKIHPLSKPVLQFTKKGEFVAEYPSMRIASEKTNIAECCIGGVCNNYYKSTHGFIFIYKEQYTGKTNNYSHSAHKKVVCLNNFYVFENMNSAARYCNLKSGASIKRAVIGKAAYAGKSKDTNEPLYWMDYDEYVIKYGKDKLIEYD